MWSCRFRKLPFLNLSLGEWQARPGPHRQVPTLPSSCQPARASLLKPVALLTRLKEGTSRRTPPTAGLETGGPRLCREVFFSRSVSAKKRLDSFRASDPSLTLGITEISLRPLARQCSRNSTMRPPLKTCPGSPSRKKWPSRVDRPCFRGLARRGLGPVTEGTREMGALASSAEPRSRLSSVQSSTLELFRLALYSRCRHISPGWLDHSLGIITRRAAQPFLPSGSCRRVLSASPFARKKQLVMVHATAADRLMMPHGHHGRQSLPRQSSVLPFLPRRAPTQDTFQRRESPSPLFPSIR